MDEKVKPLYIADSFESLDSLVQKDEAIKSFKKGHKFSSIAKKMMSELLHCQEDQERCYILSRRYIALMNHIFKISDDLDYTRSLYIGDYHKVEQLIVDLRVSLAQRYKTEFTSDSRSSDDGLEIPDSPRSSRSVSTEGGSYFTSNADPEGFKEPQIFKDKFIQPADLFYVMTSPQKLLLIDVRKSHEFKDARIHVEGGELINIPGDLIGPGSSANSLGHRLAADVREIWEKRDTFDIIILMDYDTPSHFFAGSKLEHLRSSLTMWDIKRTYKQEPYILDGGLKEFVEWYPSEVDNSQLFLRQTNSEIDELLDLDSVMYPETGTGTQMNLKLHSINSVGNLESRIQRDFGPSEDIDEVPNLHSRSEGHLPLDFYVSKDRLSAGPYKSRSQEALPREYFSSDPLVEHSHLSEFFGNDNAVEPMVVDEAKQIEEVLADERTALLRKARIALKPKLEMDRSDEGEPKRGKPNDGEYKPPKKDPQSCGMTPFFLPPSVNRLFKPSLPSEGVVYGEGYTGLRNVRNICYMNCLLQCLKVIPVIKATYVTSDRYLHHQTRIPPKINPHMAKVLRDIWGGTYYHHKTFLIEEFKDHIVEYAPMYNRNTHEDTFEFFIFLFNLLSEDCAFDLPRPKVMTESEKAWYGHLQGRTSFLVDTFYYQLKNTKVCWNCRRPNLSFETDSTLMLPVYQSTCQLQKLIDDYMKENLVSDYSCSDCKCTATIVNMKEIVVDPEVLVIVMKRYIANMDGTFRKNQAPIQFPLEGLRFGNSKYACYGIVQHSGTLGHGHYFASVLLDDKNKYWVSFNDEQVLRYNTFVNESFGIQISAAGFFYVREYTK